MKFGNLPEVVIFTEFGIEHKALVIGSRTLEHHVGENDEPLLNLVIVKPVVLDECVKCHFPERNHGKPFPPGALHRPCDSFEGIAPVASVNPAEYVHIETDVPHESHQFSEEAIKALFKQGVSTSIAYPGNNMPGGRWREVDAGGIPIPPVVAVEGGALLIPDSVREMDKPSAADLDAIAAEEKAKEDTSGEEPPPTVN